MLFALASLALGRVNQDCCSWSQCNQCDPTTTYCESGPSECANCNGMWCGGPGPSPSGGSAAVTTRYWDCCKQSCSWPGNCPGCSNPVKTCNRDGSSGDLNAKSICGGGGDGAGPVYTCPEMQPFQAGATLYAFAAGGGDIITKGGCCACYHLDFTSSSVVGTSMIIQVTNTGGDLGQNHFDIMMPGGGFGIFDGCSGSPPNGQAQFDKPDSAWGQRYGGVSNINACNGLPSELVNGCKWRFTAFKGADNPGVNFKEVTCPDSLVAKSNCRKNNEVAVFAEGALYSNKTRMHAIMSERLKANVH